MAKHGIAHVEIPASRPKEDAQFYGELFGWELVNPTATGQGPDGTYWQFRTGDAIGGGFNMVNDGGVDNSLPIKPGEVIIYIYTDDIEETLARAEALGAKTVIPKTSIGPFGWFAIFTDLTGNRVGLFTQAEGETAG